MDRAGLIASLEEEWAFLGLEAPPHAAELWTEEQIVQFFDSDGETVPAAPTSPVPTVPAIAPDAAVQPGLTAPAAGLQSTAPEPTPRTSGPALPLPATTAAALVRSAEPSYRPKNSSPSEDPSIRRPGTVSVRGNWLAVRDGEAERALSWMVRKAALKQDMYLLADAPGCRARYLAFEFCRRTGRQCQYMSLTRDTVAADLKQCREISKGQLQFLDRAPISAARNGDVLVLEGVQYAERNVLPTLNNLLENRQVALDDGTFLSLEAEDVSCRVSAAFLVIAIGLPVPRYHGTPLDPPLRSRFAGRNILTAHADDLVTSLTICFPTVDQQRVKQVVATIGALQILAEGSRVTLGALQRLPRPPYGAAESVISLLAHFPRMTILSALRRVLPLAAGVWQSVAAKGGVIQLDNSQQRALHSLASSLELPVKPPSQIYELTLCIATDDKALAELTFELRSRDAALTAVDKLSVKELKAELKERGVSSEALRYCVEKADFCKLLVDTRNADVGDEFGELDQADTIVKHTVACGGHLLSDSIERSQLVESVLAVASQRRTVAAVAQDHVVGCHVCLVGQQGVGKTLVARAAATMLGFRCHTLFCYDEMNSRDFLQRRGTTGTGDTLWFDSVLVSAAKEGRY